MKYYIKHSAKGSEWEKHKYIKKVDGVYFYPDSYEGGRHLSDSSKTQYGEYSKDDPDFDEKNYADSNRLGDTDFFGFQNKNGQMVILEEDMKWVLPKGTKITPELVKKLEAAVNKPHKNSAEWQKDVDAVLGTDTNSPNDPRQGQLDIDATAREIIRGGYGNGSERKAKLGANYEAVQKRVNEMLKSGNTGSSSKKEEKKKEEKKTETKKTSSSKNLRDKGYSDSKTSGSEGVNKKKLKHSDVQNTGWIIHAGRSKKDGAKIGSGRYPLGSGKRPRSENNAIRKEANRTVRAVEKSIRADDKRLNDMAKDMNKSIRNANRTSISARDYGDVSKSISTIGKNSSNLLERSARKDQAKAKSNIDLSKMSDKELRQKVNRIKLEEYYKNHKTSDVAAGKRYAGEWLQTVGDIAGIAASAAIIAAVLKGL